MKLGEALLERDLLNERLELLERRLSDDLKQGKPTAHLQEELQRTANQGRDIAISIDWTEQNSLLSSLPLGAYRIRARHFENLAAALEEANREKADEYWESANKDRRLVNAAIWLIDLKIPGSKENNQEDE